MPKLIMFRGPSASGKSTQAKQMLQEDGNAIRLNRDEIRLMSIPKWTPKREGWIIAAEDAMASAAAKLKKTIIVDDTNLMPKNEEHWKTTASSLGYEFKKIEMMTDFETCVSRDANREGSAKVGRQVIERQFLRAGLWKIPEEVCPPCCPTCHGESVRKKTVIFDIDGTLADLTHRVPWITIGAACPNCKGMKEPGHPMTHKDGSFCKDGLIIKKNHDMFYSMVRWDEPIEVVIKWVQECYKSGYHVVIVSGRSPENGCDDNTETWLRMQGVPYNHLIMRRPNMHGPDVEEKQLILDDILKMIPKEDIAFVVDDRPSVIKMWRDNGLRVFPVRGRDDDKFYEVLNDLEETHPQSQETEMDLALNRIFE